MKLRRLLFSWPVIAGLFLLVDAGVYVKRREVLELLGYGPQSVQVVSAPTPASAAGAAARPAVRRARHSVPIVSDERMEQIRKAIDYHPPKGVSWGGHVELLVSLNSKDAVESIEVLGGQFDPAYAKAVQKAIRASGPFPPKTARMFSLSFADGR